MVDLAFLEKFTKGDISKMKRYISLYLDTAPGIFEKMQQNIKDRSWSELAVHAHSLKPQARYMGISVLEKLLIEIENKAKSDMVDELGSLFEEANRIHQESEVLLKKFLESK